MVTAKDLREKHAKNHAENGQKNEKFQTPIYTV
jgi:hypothetical protein